MIKAVIFDMDGVIADSESLWEQMFFRYLQENGVVFANDKKLQQLINVHFRGRKQSYITNIIKKKFHLTGSYNKILNDRLRILFSLFDKKLKPIPGTILCIKRMYAADYPIVLASSSPHRVIQYVMKRFSLKKYFRHIVSADDVRLGKPHPDIFLRAVKLLKEKPGNILVVEDSISGILAARRAGTKCLALRRAYTPKKYNMLADMVVNSLAHFPISKLHNL
jgi:HAD superfamily hydrolase (TIGR01509 family)